MVSHNSQLIVIHKIVIAFGQKIVILFIFGSKLLDSIKKLCFLHLVVFNDWPLQLSLKIVDLFLIWIPIRLIELSKMIFQRFFIILYAVHRLFQLCVIALNTK